MPTHDKDRGSRVHPTVSQQKCTQPMGRSYVRGFEEFEKIVSLKLGLKGTQRT